jgi:AcrR family transcriptional regulator
MSSADETSTSHPRLRPGPGGLPRGQVTAIQRSRMLTSAVQTVEQLGYSGMTVAQVIGRAKVSRKTFYDVFADREDCFLAAFDHVVAQARALVLQACVEETGWRETVRAGLARLLRFMDDEPGLARLCVVEALGAGGKVMERRAQVLSELAAFVDRGRRTGGSSRELPAVTAEGIVGAVFTVVHTRVAEDDQRPLSDLLGSLMSMIVLPYLGAAAASRELSRPAPELNMSGRVPVPAAADRDPLEGLKMRLTYRTVRVLIVIGEHPGVSNREVAESSDIADPGQISKLLMRLQRLDLVENRGGRRSRGATNAWHLTERGAEVEHAARLR